MKKKILVFGSFVVDLMARTPHLPVPGETVKGSLFQMGAGGKGFNQCVAAHKAGANVTMVTKLGKDSFAEVALGTMRQLGMDMSEILYSDTVATGSALIMVDENTSQNRDDCSKIRKQGDCGSADVIVGIVEQEKGADGGNQR